MSTITQTITALPTPSPNYTTQQPAAFSSNAQALASALPTLVSEFNTATGQINTVAGEVNVNAASALASATAAGLSETAAVAAANFAGAWSGLTGAQTEGISVSHKGALWLLLVNVADVTADEPGSSASWIRAYGAGQIYARTSNVELTAEDNGKIFDVTSGTFSQTFDACANLGPNWCVYFRGGGTGTVTFDPDGSELIDGAATKVLKKDTLTMILCDGSALTTIEFVLPLTESYITVTTGNSHGAVNDRIRRFTTTLGSAGTDITYTDSANDGGSFTINRAAEYEIEYSDGGISATSVYAFGVSLNSAALTTDVSSIAAADRIGFNCVYNESSGHTSCSTIKVRRKFAAGDVIRAHNGSSGANLPDATSAAFTSFTIRKVGV